MVEPATMAAIIASTLKLLEGGLKVAIWEGWGGTYPSRDRLDWLSKLVGMNADVIGKAGDLLRHITPPRARPEQGVQLWAVCVASFGEALALHWGGSTDMAGRPGRVRKWFLSETLRARVKDVEAATKFALDLLLRAQGEVLPRVSWWEAPTASPQYRALWRAFREHEVAEGTPPLLACELSGDVQRFEGQFKVAFREALARVGNAELRAVLCDGQPRGETLRELLVSQMAGWRHNHVFANVDTSEGIPELPLERSYVEPIATVKLGESKKRGPVLGLLENLLAEHRVVFVSADFGMGKSLTARTLASRWAAAYLDPQSTAPVADRVFPLYVRCGGRTSLRDGLDSVFRRALKRSADTLGVSVPLDDPALDPQSADQRSVALFDGLDEMVLSPTQLRDLVQEIDDYATDNRRVIVFSRPEALPRRTEFPMFPRVVIEPFSDEQIDEWLWAWPRETTPDREKLAAHGLRELASVPILLFMLALTWERYSTNQGNIRRVQVYEMFFDILASGKYERGGEVHPPIRLAAEQARDALITRKELPRYQSEEDGRRRAVEAIRWLMERVAWEFRRREFSGEVLLSRHVSNLLETELRVPERTLEDVRIGLLLGMQAQLEGGSQQFFFGHRSFLEFAVARYWERHLRRLSESERSNEILEETLWGAPLLEQGSRAFGFLLEMLAGWEQSEQRRLLTWARATVADETMGAPRDQRMVAFRTDPRILIRHAALAIGGHLAGILREPFEVSGDLPLFVSIWWITAKRAACVLEAPNVRFSERSALIGLVSFRANLFKASLFGANLAGARLLRANLMGADLREATLDGADLGHAFLHGANLKGAALFRASLQSAKLEGANLEGALLIRADLFGADLLNSILDHANLMAVNLADANLRGARLNHANLSGASLQAGHLDGANLECANLVRANLQSTNLTGANLTGANLTGANLMGANLMGANLERADLTRVRYNQETRWPIGFRLPTDERSDAAPDEAYVSLEPDVPDGRE